MGTSSATAWPKSQLCVKVLCRPNRTGKKGRAIQISPRRVAPMRRVTHSAYSRSKTDFQALAAKTALMNQAQRSLDVVWPAPLECRRRRDESSRDGRVRRDAVSGL